MVAGLGSAGVSVHRDVYKLVKPLLVDRHMNVRVAAAKVRVVSSRLSCVHPLAVSHVARHRVPVDDDVRVGERGERLLQGVRRGKL